MTPEKSAEIFGMLSAVQVAIRAIIRNHPDKDGLAKDFQIEHEEMLALLVAMPIGDEAIVHYRNFLLNTSPHPERWLSS